MVKKKAKRMDKFAMREYGRKDKSPKWEGADAWSGPEFTRYFQEAQKYYNLEGSSKDLKQKIIKWMGLNDYDSKTIAAYKKTKDWRTSVSLGGVAANLLNGMPAVHPGFNGGKNTVVYLKERIAEIISDGEADIEVDETGETKKEEPIINIQDRLREAAGKMSGIIEDAIDSYIKDPEAFNPADYKIANMLRSNGAKAPHARYIKSFYENYFNDYAALADGTADEGLKESYSHLTKKQIKKLFEFHSLIQTACDQIIAEAKVLKKPRAKRVKPIEERVKKVKFKLNDDKLGVSSVHPVQIVGAAAVVVYNTKNRKIGYYTAKDMGGLAIKGTSIIEFSSSSKQRTLRKPEVQIKEFKEQNTQKRFETWFDKIKTTAIDLNGRLNEDIVILKVFKP
jgi:hypothetical protein